MTESRWVHRAAVAGMVGGAAFILEFLLYPSRPALAEMSLLAAYALTAVGLVGFHVLQQRHYGRIGPFAVSLACLGSLGAIVAMMVIVAGGPDLDLLHTIGALLVIVGYVFYGVATLQAAQLPRWCGIAFVVAGPVTFAFLGFGGSTTLVFGLFWLALGAVLWFHANLSSRRQASPHSSRSRLSSGG